MILSLTFSLLNSLNLFFSLSLSLSLSLSASYSPSVSGSVCVVACFASNFFCKRVYGPQSSIHWNLFRSLSLLYIMIIIPLLKLFHPTETSSHKRLNTNGKRIFYGSFYNIWFERYFGFKYFWTQFPENLYLNSILNALLGISGLWSFWNSYFFFSWSASNLPWERRSN